METTNEIKSTLEIDKKNRIIERYLEEKYKTFKPAWLDTPNNYQYLYEAIDFFYNLDDDNLSISAIGSVNEDTRKDYKEEFAKLAELLDKCVVFVDSDPPISLSFNKKEAILKGIELKQSFGAHSLRDLHAQSNNLGVAEKFLNAELGQEEWLNEVDLERALTKLNVKDRVHITRLNVDDIGMILHFEREKHKNSVEPYSIPLLINCGSSGSLRSQGSHWTEALIQIDPAAGTVKVDYKDSMPISSEVEVNKILTEAIHYHTPSAIRFDSSSELRSDVMRYEAFPNVLREKVFIELHSDNSQLDTWSCGYRALYNLLNHEKFPANEINKGNAPWSTFANASYDSESLRNAFYQLSLENLQINENFFAAMQLDKDAFTLHQDGKSYELSKDYMELLTSSKLITISSEQFATDYKNIIDTLDGNEFKTILSRSNEQFEKKLQTLAPMSSDAKIFALLDLLADKYNHAPQGPVGKTIHNFCEKQFGVILSKGPTYHFKEDSLILTMLAQLGNKTEKESLPPPITGETKSAPTLSSTAKITAKMSPSKVKPEERRLLKDQKLSRVGMMFGKTQFCYGAKPGGVEPGFKAIDLDEAFFEQLKKITPPQDKPQAEINAYNAMLNAIDRIDQKGISEEKIKLKLKQETFSTFINAYMPEPIDPQKKKEPSHLWLCEGIKEAIKNNDKLSAWLYKLDYAEKGARKERKKANKEALREFVGTRLAGIFSDQNQKQKIICIKGPTGPHALLACGWKNNLKELSEFLHGGEGPDYKGVLVEDPKARIKHAKHVPGLGKNLIFCLAIGDRDGIGQNAQNKGLANNAFYGFDYGKPYEFISVCGSLKDDFTFTNPGASTPEFLRKGTVGVIRHIMYRNYSIFYDTEYSERMMGVHFLNKMITGKNPSEEIIKSYPGLRQELYRIQQRTPSAENLLNHLREIRTQCKESSDFQNLVDNLAMQIGAGKLRNFDMYFAEIKIDLLAEAMKTKMPYDELKDHLTHIDEWAKKAAESNQDILKTFQERLLLTKEEVNFLDRIEKVFSPTSVMSHDGKAFLNYMQINTQNDRIPFQLTKQEDGSYLLTTPDRTIKEKLNTCLKLDFVPTKNGLSCKLDEKSLTKVMNDVSKQYEFKKQELSIQPIIILQTLPYLQDILTDRNPNLSGKIEYKWLGTKALSLHVTAKTTEQSEQVQKIFKLSKLPELNKEITVEIPSPQDLSLLQFQKNVNEAHQQSKFPLQTKKEDKANKWENINRSYNKEELENYKEEPGNAKLQLKTRFLIIAPENLVEIIDTIDEMSLNDVATLLSYNDLTLQDKANLNHIINEEIDEIIPQEEIKLGSTDAPTSDQEPNVNVKL